MYYWGLSVAPRIYDTIRVDKQNKKVLLKKQKRGQLWPKQPQLRTPALDVALHGNFSHLHNPIKVKYHAGFDFIDETRGGHYMAFKRLIGTRIDIQKGLYSPT